MTSAVAFQTNALEPVALPRFEPALDCSAFVRAVVVQDEMDGECRGHLLFELIEELEELLTPMASEATADDLAI